MKKLHVKLDVGHSAYQWLNSQADKIGARGHIGTHLDCYTCVPEKSQYDLSAYIVDCTKEMPDTIYAQSLPSLKDKALVLHTGNMEKNDYGSEKYFEAETFLSKNTVKAILEQNPSFIIIDSHGIGKHGKEHISLDKLCENHGCHVIENADLSSVKEAVTIQIRIIVDLENQSTGKPCELYSE